jgi:type VI secretion system protein ImpH
MANDRWRSAPGVLKQLETEPYRFDFYQAVKIFERAALLAREAAAAEGKRPPPFSSVGEGVYPEREAVRFESSVGHGFAASSIQDVSPPATPEQAHTMLVNFLGLAGHNGPLPAPYVELIAERAARHDDAPRAFLDIFNHRLVSLMARIRRKHRFTLDPRPPGENPFAEYLHSLFGMGTAGLRGQMDFPDRALLHYTGLLAAQPRSAWGLEAVIADYFKIPVRVAQFQGAWYPVAEDETTRLGRSGRSQRLGRSAMLGRRTWSEDWRFELILGPLPAARFASLLPSGSGSRALCALTRFYVGTEFDFDVRLILERADVPHLSLRYPRIASAAGEGQTTGPVAPEPEQPEQSLVPPEGPRLGWTSFLGRRSAPADVEVFIAGRRDDQIGTEADRWVARGVCRYPGSLSHACAESPTLCAGPTP